MVVARRRIWPAAAAILLAGSLHASATLLNWDANGTTPINGGTGIWDTSSLRWDDGTGTYFAWNNTTPDAAIFGVTAGTVTLGTGITAASLTTNVASYVFELNGNGLTVNGATAGSAAATIQNTSGTSAAFVATGNLAVATTLAGNMDVTLGSGWAPTSTNTFTGTLTFKPTATAILLTTNSNQLGSASGLIKLDATTAQATINFSTPGSTQVHTYTRDIQLIQGTSTSAFFRVNGALEVTLSGVISGGTAGGLGLQFGGSNQGNLILTGNNTYFGTTTLGSQANMLTLASNNALGNSSGVTMGSTAETLAFLGGITLANTNTINITGNTVAPDSGYGTIHNLGGNNRVASAITWTNGTVKTFGAEGGSQLTLTGVLGGGGAGIAKIGYGTIVLSGQNTFGQTNAATAVDATDIREGTLRLDFSQAAWETSAGVQTNIINNGLTTNTNGNLTSQLFLSGGTLEVVGKAGETDTQNFKNFTGTGAAVVNAFTVNAGASAVNAIQNGATNLTINLGKLYNANRKVGGTVDFTLPTAGSIVLPAQGIDSAGTSNTILTANGVAFATVGGNDWAALDSGRNIIAGSSVAGGGFYTANTASTLSGNADMSGGLNTALTSSPVLTSLRFNDNAARSIDATGQVLTTGGILVTAAVGHNLSLISGGTLRGNDSATGNLQDLVIIQNNTAGELAISATVTNTANGNATGLTKSGAGTVSLGAANTYTGETHLNGGLLKLVDSGSIGSGKLFFQGGVLGLTGGTNFTRALSTASTGSVVQWTGSGGFAAYGGDVTINLGGAGAAVTFGTNTGTTNPFVPTGSALIFGSSDSDGTVIFENPIALRSPNAPQQREFRVFDGASSTNVDARLTGTISSDGGITKTGNGVLELAGGTSTYLGQTIIEAGTLRLGAPNTLSSSSAVTVHAGTLDLNGNSTTIQRLTLNLGGGGAGTTAAITTGAGTLTLGTNVVYNGNVANDNGATISGNLSLGTTAKTFTVNHSTAAATDLTVSAAITSGAGGALVKAGNGTMDLTAANSYSGATTVAAGTLLVSGSIAGSAAVQSGATLGGTGVIGGAVTVSSGGILAPGRTTGTLDVGGLTLGASATFKLELGGATAGDGPGSYDQVNMTNAAGSISLDGTAAITLSLQGGYTPQSSDVFFVLNRADSGIYTTSFAGAGEGATINFGNGITAQITYLANWNFGAGTGALTGGNDVALYNFSTVPEPGPAASLLIGFGSLLGLQRFRRRR